MSNEQKKSDQGLQLGFSLSFMRRHHNFPCRNMPRSFPRSFINPGQVPVIVGDCPLYAQQKKCQWKFTDEVGESKMMCFMSFLHIEMASRQCGGKLSAGSGWEWMFSFAKVFSPGVVVSLLGGSHVKRTRYLYQLTLPWLHVLKVQSYNEYCQTGCGPHEPVEMWEKRLNANAPTICY